MDDLNQQIVEAGNWWFDPWWLEDSWYHSDTGLQKVNIVEAISLLKEVLTSAWVKSLGDDPISHPFMQLIHFGQGWWQLNGIYELADCFKVTMQIDGHQPVIGSYMKVEQAASARLELFLAYVMTKAGYEVSFIRAKPKKGRTPDLLVKRGDLEFVVECKSLKQSDTEDWLENYSRAFSFQLMRSTPSAANVGYIPRTKKLNPSDFDCEGSYLLAAAVDAQPIVRVLNQHGPFSPEFKYVDIGAYGELWFWPENIGLQSQMVMPEIIPGFIARRLLGNGVNKASKQISEYGMPGIVAVFYSNPPDIGVIKQSLSKYFKQNRVGKNLVMGVLIFPAGNMLRYIPPIWVENPYAVNPPENYGLPTSLSQQLDPVT